MIISKADYEALKAKKIEELTEEELKKVSDYEASMDNDSNNSSNSDNNSGSSSGNSSVIDEISDQNIEKLADKISKKTNSAEYQKKIADKKTIEDNQDIENKEPKSILSTITGFLLLFGVLGSVFVYAKKNGYFWDSKGIYQEATEQEAETARPNKEPKTESKSTEFFND